MKKTCVCALAALLLAAPATAGVVKKTRSSIVFQKFGSFNATATSRLTPEMSSTDSLSEFKGKGLTGGLIGKTLFRSGNTAQIIDLAASTITTIDNKKKEYTVGPIRKLSEEMEEARQGAEEEPQEKEEPSTIKITKNEFTVTDTGEEAAQNGFPCRKYIVLWLTEWEDTQTGDKGSSRLESAVWTTPMSDTLREAQAEELKFNTAYLQKIGLNLGQAQSDMLGTKWLAMLDAFGRPGSKPKQDYSRTAAEMDKVKGYPIVIDGRYDIKAIKAQGAAGGDAEEAEEAPSGIKGGLGGFLKKSLKKKPSDAAPKPDEPTLTYRIETLEISTPSLSAADFQVPVGYKKKG